MNDPTRTFLARGLPWNQTGAACHYNLHYRNKANKWRGSAYKDLDDMCRQVDWLKKQADVTDIYVCMSSQTMATAHQVAGGRTIYFAQRSVNGAFELKSIWFDVDVKQGAYATTQDAINALKKFMLDSGMPIPTMFVASGGGGFHCHWILDRALKPDEWKRLSTALAHAAKQHGFIIDAGVTTDAARILRIPNTLNYKYTPPRDVLLGGHIVPRDYTVEEITAILTPYMAAQAAFTPGVTGTVHKISANDDLSAGIASATFSMLDFKSAVEFLDNLSPSPFAKGGYDGIRDLMFACVYVETTMPEHVQAVRDVFDAVVTKNDRTPEDNAKRYNAALQAAPGRIAAGATDMIKPASIFKMAMDKGWGAPKVQPGVREPDLPPGYTRETDGTIWVSKTNAQGLIEQWQVARFSMEDAWITREPMSLNWRSKIGKKVRTISITHERAARKDNVGPTLAAQQFIVQPPKVAILQEFLLAWITHLQHHKPTSNAASFGWTGDGFAYGGVIHSPGGSTQPAGASDPYTQRIYDPCGTLQPWLNCAKIVTDENRPALNAILAAGFAGPLIKLLGQDGLLISAYSQESGIGKSTALRIAQAIWGHPIEGAQSLTDTAASTINKLGEIRNLPLFWDEIKSEEQIQKFVDIAFQLSSGRERSRLTQTASQRKPGTWETLIMSCSNDSIADTIASGTKTSTAGVYRVFEFRVPPAAHRSTLDVSSVTVAISDLRENYGQAGLLYASYLGSNRDAIRTALLDFSVKFAKSVQATQEERYWIACMVALIAGAQYANALGLTNIDVAGLRDFLLGQLTLMRAGFSLNAVSMKRSDNVSNILAEFLLDHKIKNTVYTNIIYPHSGKPPPQAISIVRHLDATFTVPRVQIGLQDRKVRISASLLSDWLRTKKLSRQSVVKAFEEMFNATYRNVTIAAGTDKSTSQMQCFDLDIDTPAMRGFFEEI